MKRLVFLPLFFLVGCPGPAAPRELWIAEDGSEAALKLVDSRPAPF
jgi:hypothetical protein